MTDHYACLCTRDCAHLLSAVAVCGGQVAVAGVGDRRRRTVALCVGGSEHGPGEGEGEEDSGGI